MIELGTIFTITIVGAIVYELRRISESGFCNLPPPDEMDRNIDDHLRGGPIKGDKTE